MLSFFRKNNEEDKTTAKDAEKSSSPNTTVKTPSLDDIPNLIDLLINSEDEHDATAAAQCIYKLCDINHKYNRVPMICSGKYNVLIPLLQCLAEESKFRSRRKFACLALSNLSLSERNKEFMAREPFSKDIIDSVSKVIAYNEYDSYLGCICLLNLSLLETSNKTMLQHSPITNGKHTSPLDSPNSLLRVLERIFTTFPVAPLKLQWACGLIKNLVESEENAVLIAQTKIPKCIVDHARTTIVNPYQWKRNSTEAFSVQIILSLLQWPQSRKVLIDVGAIEMISIMAKREIQAFDGFVNIQPFLNLLTRSHRESRGYNDTFKTSALVTAEVIVQNNHTLSDYPLATAVVSLE